LRVVVARVCSRAKALTTMLARSLSPLLATTLIAVATPQLARAAQPEAGADASVGASAAVDTTGPETATTADTSSTSESSAPAAETSTTTVAVVPVPGVYGIKGKWRVHFDVDFLVQPRPNDLQDVGASQIVKPFYGLGFGYGIHKNLVLGARLAFNFTRVRDRSDAALDNDVLAVQRSSAGAFAPYIEYLPLSEGRILPFLGARAGFAWTTDTVRMKSDAGDMGGRTSEIGPTVGLSAGAHFFLAPSFSFDVAALFDTRWLFGRTRALGDGAPDPGIWVPSTAIMSLGLGLGMSGWF
jgi:hypothetical protein